MAQAGSGDGATGILSPDGQHIIVHTIAPSLGENGQLQQQVIIGSSSLQEDVDEENEAGSTEMTTTPDGLVDAEQGLHSLTRSEQLSSEIENSFESNNEEIVPVSQFQPVTADQDMLSHNVFETVSS